MLLNLFRKTLRDQRWSVSWWSLGFVFISLYISYFYPYISGEKGVLKMLDSLPPVLKNMMGNIADLATPEGFFSLQPFMFFAPVFIIIFSISKGGDVVAGEVCKGTLDILLSKPVSRVKLIMEKSKASITSLLIINVIFFISFYLSLLIFDIKINTWKLGMMIFSFFVFSVTFYSISLFVGVISLKKNLVNGIVGGVAFVSLIIGSYSASVESLRTVSRFTPVYYYNGNSPLVNGPDFKLILIQICIALFFFLSAMFIFKRKDLYV